MASKNDFSKIRKPLLGFVLAFCFSSFTAYSKDNDFLIDKEIRICGNNTLPINLNTAIGVAFSNGKGNWLDENNKIVSNVFVLPENSTATEYVFRYFVNSDDAYCGLEKNDKYRIKIRVGDKLIIALQQDPDCEEKMMKIRILSYNKSLKYFIEPKGLDVDSEGVIWDVDPDSEFSIYATDGYCISEATKLMIDELPAECDEMSCEELWDKIVVNQLITPNGDDMNDELVIEGLEQYYKMDCVTYRDGVNLLIFNRWGSLVYTKHNYMKEGSQDLFDGYSSNYLNLRDKKPLPAGTYFYILRSGGESVKRGFIQIVTE